MRQMSGVVVSVNISEKKGTVKTPVESGELCVGLGLAGDAHAGPGVRQVSLLAEESIEKMRRQGAHGLVSGSFAENITTRGVELHTLPVGTRLRIGETLHVVTQIGKECHKGCAIRAQVGDCVMPREGIFTNVLKGGMVRAGDPVAVLPPARAGEATAEETARAAADEASGEEAADAVREEATEKETACAEGDAVPRAAEPLPPAGANEMPAFSHLDAQGNVRMVDVSGKAETERTAVAAGRVRMLPQTLAAIYAGALPKGDVLAAARIAGIMATKRTSELIPMCHLLPLHAAEVHFARNDAEHAVDITAAVSCTGKTGVEMEALTAVSVAALTLYDMCKAVDKGMTITDVRLMEKSGGKSGHYRRK